MDKISLAAFENFERWYWGTEQELRRIRFGQAFLTKMLPGTDDAALYYERNCAVAKGMIIEKYVR